MTEYKSLQTIAYERLRSMIRTGKLTYNTMYSEARLAAELSISRTPMREALVRLESERYIDILPSRGFQMHFPSQSDIREAAHMRKALESYCVCAIAGEHMQPAGQSTIEQMQSHLRGQEAMVLHPDQWNIASWWEHDLNFHRCMIQHLNIPGFQREFDTYMHFFSAESVRDYVSKKRELSTIDEHRAILEALRAGDAIASVKAVNRHTDQTLETVLNSLQLI